MNVYTYARNNPVVLVDPDGNFWGPVISAVFGIAMAAWDLLTTPTPIAYAPTNETLNINVKEKKPLENISASYAALSQSAQAIVDISVGVVVAGVGGVVKSVQKTAQNIAQSAAVKTVEAPAVKRITQIKVKPLFSSRNLERNMTIKGMGKPDGFHAHHIVAGGDKRATRAREILSDLEINLDSSANGVYLEAPVHQGTHTNKYYRNLTSRLEKAKSQKQAIKILERIRNDLLNGKFPK